MCVRSWLGVPGVLTLAVALALAGAGCGDEEATTTTSSSPAASDRGAASPPERSRDEPPPRGDGSGPARETRNDRGSGGPSGPTAERAAARVVRDYVAALDDRDGERVCVLLVPGALDGVALPRERGGCAASLDASIGYRDPRGLPAFDTARLLDIPSVELNGDEARVTASIVTEFADRDEPSVEDDIVYLQRGPGGNWLIAKPSAVLHRAIGAADIPPEVISPP